MASYAVPYQVPYQNQLRFNLDVPLTTQNLAVQFSRPSPIFVERIGGQHGIPSNVGIKQAAGQPDVSMGSCFNYSTLSEDNMERMSQLAKRDLRNRKLQSQMRGESSVSVSPVSSPSRTRFQPKQSCQRFDRTKTTKGRHPVTAREAEKNRRFGAVQTPPPRRPTSHSRVGDESMMSVKNVSMNVTKDSDVYFPAKPILPEGTPLPRDEITKLQQEMKGYLLLVEHIEDRAISEGNTKFLHPPVKGKQRDGYLAAEEDSYRARVRVGEQNIRFVRNLYNLRQKVKQLQRDLAHADLNKPAKKTQICNQLGIVHRGAAKAVQTFVNQLPHQDLKGGLPTHYQELALLLRQMTALNSLTQQGRKSEGDSELLEVLDRVESLNLKWCALMKKPGTATDRKEKKSGVSKDWVSDTKVERDIFAMKNKPELNAAVSSKKSMGQSVKQQQLQGPRGRPEKKASGKENKNIGVSQAAKGKRNAELRAAINALVEQKEKTKTSGVKVPHISRAVAWEVETGKRHHVQDSSKGYLLPSDLVAKREKAQRAVQLSNQNKKFADSTISTRLKSSPGRPSSAPASPGKRKEVNFDLDRQSPLPWIPPGRSSRSRSLSSERRSRSRSPFYLREVDREDVQHIFPGKRSSRVKGTAGTEIPSFGYRSLPTDKRLRSADVSDSFIDEVERRLLHRSLGQRVPETKPFPAYRAEPFSAYRAEPYGNVSRETVSGDTTGDGDSVADEALDITDLEDVAQKKAVSLMDAPTLENIKLRLAEMQREQRQIRQKWSSLKFTDTKPRSRIFTSSEIHSEKFREPPAIEVTRMSKTERPRPSQGPVNKEWVEEPLIFTKPQPNTRLNYLHTVYPGKRDDLQPESRFASAKPPKKLVSMKQTAVERIAADRDRFDSYLRKRSHHPTGKFDPWKLVEEISDEILTDCLRDVSSEVELINEEIANHMYKSEFMVDKSQSQTRAHQELRNQSQTSLHQEQRQSPVAQEMGDRLSPSQVKTAQGDSVGDGVVQWDVVDKQPLAGNVSAWGSGDQPAHSLAKSPVEQRSHSTPRSPSQLGSGKQSPNLSAAEPMLDNVSHLLQHQGDTSGEREVTEGRGKEDDDDDDKDKDDGAQGEYQDDYEEEETEDDDDDDDEEEYSDDDFENVSNDDA